MAANIAPQRHRMLALKKWLQVWYLATTSDEPDEVDDGNTDLTVTLHVQGDKPEQDRQVSRSSLLPQSIISSPPPQGCFGQEGTFVQLYIADTSWVDLLLANNAHLVGSVVAPVCGKDCCIVDVVLPGQGPSRRCHLGQRYLRAISLEEIQAMQSKLHALPISEH